MKIHHLANLVGSKVCNFARAQISRLTIDNCFRFWGRGWGWRVSSLVARSRKRKKETNEASSFRSVLDRCQVQNGDLARPPCLDGRLHWSQAEDPNRGGDCCAFNCFHGRHWVATCRNPNLSQPLSFIHWCFKISVQQSRSRYYY
jgi:hypothetical protein